MFFLMLEFLIVTLDGSDFRCLDLDILGFLVLVLGFYGSIYFISSNRLNVFHVTMRHFPKIVHQQEPEADQVFCLGLSGYC